MREIGPYFRRAHLQTEYSAKFSPTPKNQTSPYIWITVNAYGTSEGDIVPKPSHLWTVNLSLHTHINFAEAIEFFRKIVPPSAMIDMLRYGSHWWPSVVHELPFRDLKPNLIGRVNNSGYIEMEITPPYEVIHPYAYYSKKDGRKEVEYRDTNDRLDEPTLEQILGVATLKLNPEDIQRLKGLIKQPAEFVKSLTLQ